jgi:hypothetical protein
MSMLPEKVRYQDVEMEEGVVHATVVQPTQPIVVAAEPVPVTAQIVGQPQVVQPQGFAAVAAEGAPRPPPGRWLVGTCERIGDVWCCDCQPESKARQSLWCCACWLPCVVIAQLMERVIRKGSYRGTFYWRFAASHDHIAGPENNDTSVRRRLFGTFLFGEIVKIVLAHALETRHYWLLEVAIDCVVWVLFAHYLLKIRARIRERDQIPGEDGLTEACCAYCCTGCVLCGTMGHELKLVGELYAPTENATRAGRSICCC